MTDREDPRFAELVRRAAPAERDPVFRIKVLERRERGAFRSRSQMILLAAVAAVAAAALWANLRPSDFQTFAVVAIAVCAAVAALFYGPALIRRLVGLRR